MLRQHLLLPVIIIFLGSGMKLRGDVGRFHALAEKKEHKSGLLKNDSSMLCSMQQKD